MPLVANPRKSKKVSRSKLSGPEGAKGRCFLTGIAHSEHPGAHATETCCAGVLAPPPVPTDVRVIFALSLVQIHLAMLT